MQVNNSEKCEYRSNSARTNKIAGRLFATTGQIQLPGCPVCQKAHRTEDCPVFLELATSSRWSIARNKGMCFSCLRRGHLGNACKFAERCKVSGCKRVHHSLLHCSKIKKDVCPIVKNCQAAVGEASAVHLGALPVQVHGLRKTVPVCALLDNGSDISLMDDDPVKQLGVKEAQTCMNLSTIKGAASFQSECHGMNLSSFDRIHTAGVENVLSVPKVNLGRSNNSSESPAGKWKHVGGVKFHATTDSKIRRLIGVDAPETPWPTESKYGRPKELVAVRITPGRVILRPMGSDSGIRRRVNDVCMKSPVPPQEPMYDVKPRDVEGQKSARLIDDKLALKHVRKSLIWKNRLCETAVPWRHNAHRSYKNRVFMPYGSSACQIVLQLRGMQLKVFNLKKWAANVSRMLQHSNMQNRATTAQAYFGGFVIRRRLRIKLNASILRIRKGFVAASRMIRKCCFRRRPRKLWKMKRPSTLQSRQKWSQKRQNLRPGSSIIVKIEYMLWEIWTLSLAAKWETPAGDTKGNVCKGNTI